jgi:hypothetical protein
VGFNQIRRMITKEKFKKLVKLRDEGTINMNDISRGTAITGLTPIEYKDIINNFKQYSDLYENSKSKRR